MKKYEQIIITWIALILTWTGTFAQDTRYFDSVRILLSHAESDSARLRYHFVMAQSFMKNGMADSQLVYANAAIEVASRMGNLSDKEKIYKAGAYRIKGIYYRLGGKYEEAIPLYIQALKEFEAVKDSNGQASTLNSIGIAYLNLRRYDEALQYFSIARQIDHALGRPEKEAADIQNMMNALRRDGYAPDSIKNEVLRLARLSLALSDSIGDESLIATSNEAVGIALRDLDRPYEALPYHLKALEMAEKLNQPNLIAEQLYLCGELYIALNDFDKAIEYGLRSESIAKENNFYSVQIATFDILARAFAGKHDYKNAFLYSEKLNLTLDSTYQTEIAEQLKRFESDKKDNEIILLNSQKETALTKLQRNRVALIGASILLLLLIILAYLLYRNRQAKVENIRTLQNLNTQLREQKEEISRINTLLELKALRAQMNPHFIFNCMSSIQECMLTGRLDDANTYLSKLSKLLRMVLNHSDDESVTLETELEMLTLYLELETVRLKDGFHYEIKVDEEIFPEEIKVPTLILQPFAENAIWHGLLNKPADRKLLIRIEADHETISCILEDNGVGREKAAALKSSNKKYPSKGIELVKKRLDILRDKTKEKKTGFLIEDLYSDDNQSKGTRVEITLPMIA